MSSRPAWAACLRTAKRRARGLTVAELVIGIGILTTLSLVMVGILKGGLLSSSRSTETAFLLSNARKALGGGAGFEGMIPRAQQAVRVRELNPQALSLENSGGSVTAFRLSSQGELIEESGGSSVVRAQGLEGLSVSYYGTDGGYRVAESTSPQAARLVVLSFSVPGKSRRLRLFSGAALVKHR